MFKMSDFYKICVKQPFDEFACEYFLMELVPRIHVFDDLKEATVTHMPELKGQPLKIYYIGKCG